MGTEKEWLQMPINMPFVMIEKDYVNISPDKLHEVYHKFISTEKQFEKHLLKFENPVAIHYYSIVHKAAELKGLKFNNTLKSWL